MQPASLPWCPLVRASSSLLLLTPLTHSSCSLLLLTPLALSSYSLSRSLLLLTLPLTPPSISPARTRRSHLPSALARPAGLST